MRLRKCSICKQNPVMYQRTICSKCEYKKRKKYHQSYGKKYFKSKKGKSVMRSYQSRLRESVIEYLGGKCFSCGFLDKRALQLDHVNGGGSKIRRGGQSWSKYYKELLEGKHKHEVQILCANCNWIKRYESKELSKAV